MRCARGRAEQQAMSSSAPERTPEPLSELSNRSEDLSSRVAELERRLEAHLLIARRVQAA